MKPFLFFFIALTLALNSLAQIISINPSGETSFKDKLGIQNNSVDGKKEGKWICYFDSLWQPTTENKALYYRLTQYKDGKEYGIVYDYYFSGQIQKKCLFVEGKEKGIAKFFYESGKLSSEINYIEGKKEGVQKWYSEKGILKMELP